MYLVLLVYKIEKEKDCLVWHVGRGRNWRGGEFGRGSEGERWGEGSV